MKNITKIVLALMVLSFTNAYADENKDERGDEKHVPAATLVDEKNNSSRTMKISEDEKNNEVRRENLMEEIRKLYKANFL